MDISNIIQGLLAQADQAYHDGDSPVMSDGAYDSLRQQVPELETVGAPALTSSFQKVAHVEKLRSLDNVFTPDELSEWISRMEIKSGLVCECKLDGLALCLTYVDRKLVRAATRGDGIIGDDVTGHAMYIDSIPKNLPAEIPNGEFEVTGEVLMLRSTLKAINDTLLVEGKQPLSNTRNAAAGVMRNTDPEILKSRKLVFVPYGFSQNLIDLTGAVSYHDVMCLLELAFDRSMIHASFSLTDIGARNIYQELQEARNSLDYDIDGMVVKASILSERSRLGYTSRAPNWAIAVKFPAEEAITQLTEINYTVGRTGVITPVARLQPVRVGGVIVSNCTLHNFDEIDRLGICVGSIVTIARRGDVIPKIINCLVQGQDTVSVRPGNCPSCGTPLRQDTVMLYCDNSTECMDQLIARLTYFVSREVMDIKGIGPELCDLLIRRGFVKYPFDLFKLDNHDMILLDRLIGEKTLIKLQTEINNKFTMRLDKFITGLCIDGVGQTVANIIGNYYEDFTTMYLEAMAVSTLGFGHSNLKNVVGIGPIIFETFMKGLVDNLELLQNVYAHQQDPYHNLIPLKIQAMPVIGKALANQTFVITGSFPVSRDLIKERIVLLGGKVSGSVSKKTTAIIVGTNPGTKYDDAIRLGVTVIREAKAREMGLI